MVSAPSFSQGTPGDTGVPSPSNIYMSVIPKKDMEGKKTPSGDKIRPLCVVDFCLQAVYIVFSGSLKDKHILTRHGEHAKEI